MSQYAGVCLALAGHDVRPVLAHSYAVAVAGDGKAKALPGIFKPKGGGAQAEKLPQLGAFHAHAAQDRTGHPAAAVKADLAGKKAVKLIVDSAVPVEEKKPAKKTAKKAAEKAE